MTKLLIASGSNVNFREIEGQTPLYVAIDSWNDVEMRMLKLLVEKGADVNAQTFEGSTPLFCAARHGKFQIVQFLKTHGADVSAALAFARLTQQSDNVVAMIIG